MPFKISDFCYGVLLISIAFLAIVSHVFADNNPSFAKYIFVSSNIGGRCHSALNSFLNKNTLQDEKVFFCKSSKDAIQKAEKQQGAVFLKLISVPDFHIHNDAVIALREYKILKVHAIVKQKAKYCFLRHKKALKSHIELSSVASSPYTLHLHQKWIQGKHLQEIEVPAGSLEAARLLSDGILNLNTGVITSIHASKIYDNLKVVKSSFGTNTTYDIFALIEVEKRGKAKNVSGIKQEISQIFNKYASIKKDNTTKDEIVFLEVFDNPSPSLEHLSPDLP